MGGAIGGARGAMAPPIIWLGGHTVFGPPMQYTCRNSIHTVLEIIETMLMTVTNILVQICLYCLKWTKFGVISQETH